jgi:hypothetical protein
MEKSMEKDCGRTTAEMEIQYQKELLVIAEYRGMEEVSEDRNIWRQTNEKARA